MSKQRKTPSPAPPPQPVFPIYLIPSFTFPFSIPSPFRLLNSRQDSTSSITTVDNTSENSNLPTPTPTPTPTPPILSSPTSTLSLRSLPSPHHQQIPTLHTPTPTPILRCKSCTTHLALRTQIISKGFTGRHGRAYLVSPPPLPPLAAIQPFPPPKRLERNLVNIRVGKCVVRQLVTGQHTVADIECAVCGVVVGWKYVDAREVGQRYKVGKFILEGGRVVGGWGWEDGDFEGGDGGGGEDEFMEEEVESGLFNETENPNPNENENQKLNTQNFRYSPSSPTKRQPVHSASASNNQKKKSPELIELEIEMGRRRRGDDEEGEEEGDIVVFNEDDEDECDDLFGGSWDAEVVRRRRWRRSCLRGNGGVSLWRRIEGG